MLSREFKTRIGSDLLLIRSIRICILIYFNVTDTCQRMMKSSINKASLKCFYIFDLLHININICNVQRTQIDFREIQNRKELKSNSKYQIGTEISLRNLKIFRYIDWILVVILQTAGVRAGKLTSIWCWPL